ncbi:uncharacterized protein [Antedon mediterranea]|uniref:uncharacterized protein n=1 Tax=Antedon mediterranea TaxID=105859 RepID=UPI003AF9330E
MVQCILAAVHSIQPPSLKKMRDILLPSATSTDESPGRRQPDAIPPHLSPPDLITLREDVSDMETIQVPVEEEIAQDPAFAEVMHQVTAAINRLETDEEREEGIMLVEEETGQLSLSRDHQRKTRDRKRKRGLPEPEPILPPDDVVHSPNFPSVNEIASITDDIPLRVTQLDDIEQIVPRPPPEETPRTDKAVAPPNLELSPIVEIIPPVVRRRKRSLFVDQETQLHKTDMRHNMATSGDLCKKNDVRYYTIISIPKHPSARELFNLPTRVGMRKSKPMMAIWKRHAVPCDYESPSEYENQIWSTIYLREMASDEDNTRELSDIERIRRTMTESRSLLLTDLTSLSETRERDADRFSSSLARPLTTNSIEEVPRELEMAEQQQTEFDPIPEHILGETGRELGSSSDEVPIELVPEQQIELDDIRYGQRDIRELDTVTVHEEKIALADLLNGSEQSFARDISNLMEDGSVTFLELCPYTTYRQAVARMFYVCLVLCEKGVIKVSQPEFYGTITIERGPNFPLF